MAKRPKTVVDVIALRKENLRALAVQWGGPVNLAKQLGLKGSSYLSQLASGHRAFTEKTARKYEDKLGLSLGWFDQDHDGHKGMRPIAVDSTLFPRAMALCRALVQETGVRMSSGKFADLVTLSYEEAKRTGVVSEAYIKQLLNLLEK